MYNYAKLNKFDSKSTPFEAEDILTPLSVKKSSDDIPPHYNISIIKSRPLLKQ